MGPWVPRTASLSLGHNITETSANYTQRFVGRRWPLLIAVVSFTAFSAANALAPNLASYFMYVARTQSRPETSRIHMMLFRDVIISNAC